MTECRNCLGCCMHSKVEPDDLDERGVTKYRHFCDKNPEGFKEWHKQHCKELYDKYSLSSMPCYEPTEVMRALKRCLDETEKVLEKLNKNGTNNNKG